MSLYFRVSLFIVLNVSLATIVWWLDASPYDILFNSPLTQHLDLILLPCAVSFGLFLWILFDVLHKILYEAAAAAPK